MYNYNSVVISCCCRRLCADYFQALWNEKLTNIGVASCGTLGHVPLDFQLFNFSGHFRAAQTLTYDSMW